MDSAGLPPEQTLFLQWRTAAHESHLFELGLARKALSPQLDAFSEVEWQEALRLRGIANQLYLLFMTDIDSKIRNLREPRKLPPWAPHHSMIAKPSCDTVNFRIWS